MRFLLTRPREDGEAFAALLAARGHEAIIAPLMEIRFLPGPEIALGGVQGILATSANGVRALAARTRRRDVTVYAVGPQTTEAARRAGFADVVDAAGDAAALGEIVARHADPSRGALLHAAGKERAGRLSEALQAKGFTVETSVLYEAVPAERLTLEAENELRAGAIDGVFLFSPRSAKIFAGLAADSGLSEQCAKLAAFCISAATAAALPPFVFAHIAIAASPNQDAMLELVERSLSSAKGITPPRTASRFDPPSRGG